MDPDTGELEVNYTQISFRSIVFDWSVREGE
jgi:hypothetical protein